MMQGHFEDQETGYKLKFTVMSSSSAKLVELISVLRNL